MSSGKHSLVECEESRQLESPNTETRPVRSLSPPSADSSRNAAIANSAFRGFAFFCFAGDPPADLPSASSPYAPGSFDAWSARCATCTCAPVGACAMSAPVAYTMGSPDLSIAVPFKSRSPSCTPNGFSKSLSAGTLPPPVTGVQCECVLSSKNRMLSICFTLNHSANTATPRPLFKTSSDSLVISSTENSSSESTNSKAPYSRASKHVSGDPRISTKYPSRRSASYIAWKFVCGWSPCQSRMSALTSSESRGMYPGGYRTEWNCDQSTRFERGGVGATENRTGTETTLDRVSVSPRPGGLSTVNVITPLATPLEAFPDSFTRTYIAKKPLQGQSVSEKSNRKSRCAPRSSTDSSSVLGSNLGGALSHPPRPIPLTMVALNMNGIAPWYSGCAQCGHAYGHEVSCSKSSDVGTSDARGV
mmetsp:Transcript_12981/g.54475  ORF Transcript_12981/g.54475 Transcript_12981/m.54475 type:complete len:419 (-) Transcript_12981:2191-3447(-)